MVANKYNIEICNPLKLPKTFQSNYIWKFNKNLFSLSESLIYSSQSDKIYTRILLNNRLFGIKLNINEK